MDSRTTKVIKYLTLLELNFNKPITEDIINCEFRKLSQVYHPDVAKARYSDGKKFIELQEARNYLIENLTFANNLILNGFNTNDNSYNEEQRHRAETEMKVAEELKRRAEFEKRNAEELRRQAEAMKKAADEQKRQVEEKEKKLNEVFERNLKETKTELINSFFKIYSSYNQSEYSEENWGKIEIINKNIISMINNSNSVENAESYFKEGIYKLNLVDTIASNKRKNKKRKLLCILFTFFALIFLTGIIVTTSLKNKHEKEMMMNQKELIVYDQNGKVLFKDTVLKGDTINLNDLNIYKKNYRVGGYYKDKNFQNKIEYITINNNQSIYIKWKLLGNGQLNDEFLIYDENQLFEYLENNKYYKLMENIYISSNNISRNFSINCKINGDGHSIIFSDKIYDSLFDTIYKNGEISNTIVELDENGYYGIANYEGLFCDTNYGSIKNVTIKASNFKFVYDNNNSENRYVSICAAKNYGTITNVKIEGDYEIINSGGDLYFSSICGINYEDATIKNSINYANLNGGDVSGICSKNIGTIKNCANDGSIVATMNYREYQAVASGIVKVNSGKILECRNSGSIKAYGKSNSAAYSSGINFKNESVGIIEDCNNYGILTINGNLVSEYIKNYCSGINNYNYGIVQGCNNYGYFNVDNTDEFVMISGVVSYNNGSVNECANNNKKYSFTSFKGGLLIGGVVGINSETGNIEKSYNYYIDDTELSSRKSSVSGTFIGGIAARNYGKISMCGNFDVLSCTTNYYAYVAGIAASNYDTGIIENCYNGSWLYASDTSESYGSRAGGITCQNDGVIKFSHNRASVSAGSNDWSGGIAAKGMGTIENCLWVYYDKKAKYANGETKSNVGAIKCSDEKDLIEKSKDVLPNDIWDFTNDYPIIK